MGRPLFRFNNSVAESPETVVADRPEKIFIKSVRHQLVCHSFDLDNTPYSLHDITGTTQLPTVAGVFIRSQGGLR
jgi:hypothetical protein